MEPSILCPTAYQDRVETERLTSPFFLSFFLSLSLSLSLSLYVYVSYNNLCLLCFFLLCLSFRSQSRNSSISLCISLFLFLSLFISLSVSTFSLPFFPFPFFLSFSLSFISLLSFPIYHFLNVCLCRFISLSFRYKTVFFNRLFQQFLVFTSLLSYTIPSKRDFFSSGDVTSSLLMSSALASIKCQDSKLFVLRHKISQSVRVCNLFVMFLIVN